MAGGAAEGRAVRCRCAFFWCGPYACVAPNHSPNLKPTWLAIIAGRARPDEPEVVGGVQEEGW